MPARTRRTSAVLAIGTLALASAAACGSSANDSAAPVSTGTTPTATATASSTDAAADVTTVSITLTGTKVDPAPGKVDVPKGNRVRLTVTRDSTGEVHVHGYDLEKVAQAGVPVTFDFVADQPGIFEVEAHDPDRQLTQLVVS